LVSWVVVIGGWADTWSFDSRVFCGFLTSAPVS
jgi:hypothetical protein